MCDRCRFRGPDTQAVVYEGVGIGACVLRVKKNPPHQWVRMRGTYLRLLSLGTYWALFAFLCDTRAGAVIAGAVVWVLWLVDRGDNAQGNKLFSQATFGLDIFAWVYGAGKSIILWTRAACFSSLACDGHGKSWRLTFEYTSKKWEIHPGRSRRPSTEDNRD